METEANVSRRRFLTLLVAGAGAALSLSACSAPPSAQPSPTSPPATPKPAAPQAASTAAPAPKTTAAPATASIQKGGMVVLISSQDPVNFNPLLYVNTGHDTVIEHLCFAKLWHMNNEGQFVPVLATEVPSKENGGISADGLTYTWKIRKDAKWHDGQPVTAKDVVFTHETIVNPKVAVRSRIGHDRVASFEAKDDYTVVAKLKEQFVPYLLAWQAISPIPAHIFSKEADINTSKYNTEPIGSGPFRLVSRIPGDSITVEPFKDYFGPGPYLDKVVYKYVPDTTIMYTRWKTGEATLTNWALPFDRVAEAKTLPGKRVDITPRSFTEFFYFNCGNEMFADKRVRQALYLAMDRKTWVNDVYYGVPMPTLSYVPPAHWAYSRNLKDPGRDLKKAAELLDAAGWMVGPDGIRVKNGKKLSFSNSTTAGNKQREQAQQFLQANFKEIGVEMQIKNMDSAVVWGEYTTKSQFETEMVAWDIPMWPDPDYTIRAHSKQIPNKTGVGGNYAQYENAEVDGLLEQGLREVDQNKRKEIYGRIQEILFDELPFAPIYNLQTPYGVDEKLQNYKLNPYSLANTWNVAEWWIKQ